MVLIDMGVKRPKPEIENRKRETQRAGIKPNKNGVYFLHIVAEVEIRNGFLVSHIGVVHTTVLYIERFLLHTYDFILMYAPADDNEKRKAFCANRSRATVIDEGFCVCWALDTHKEREKDSIVKGGARSIAWMDVVVSQMRGGGGGGEGTDHGGNFQLIPPLVSG